MVVLNDKNADQRAWYTAKDPKKVTDLEWDPVDGSLWVVDSNYLYRLEDPGRRGRAAPRSSSSSCPGGTLTRFKPSPDGLRAVVVSRPVPASDSRATAGSPMPAAMVTLERAGDSVTLSTDTVFPLLAGYAQTQDPTSPALQSVTDAAWADGRTVVLLGTRAARARCGCTGCTWTVRRTRRSPTPRTRSPPPGISPR